MTNSDIIKKLKMYQKSSVKKRQNFFNSFEKKMIYRTTKTENPEISFKMVKKVLQKLAVK